MFLSSCSVSRSFDGTVSLFCLFFLRSRFLCCLLSSMFPFLLFVLKYSFPVLYPHGYHVVHCHTNLVRRLRLSRCPDMVRMTPLLSPGLSETLFFLSNLFSETIWRLGLSPALAVMLCFNSLFHFRRVCFFPWPPFLKFHDITSRAFTV